MNHAMAVLSTTTASGSPLKAARMAFVSAAGVLRTRLLLMMVAPSATAMRLIEVTPRSMPMVLFTPGSFPHPVRCWRLTRA